jgi:ParB family chromosome partitioning protein
MNAKARADELRRIPLAEIHESPHNPRTHYDPEALQQLADSLLQSGQLEPVLVRPRKGGGYELAAGHRRYRAAKLACQQSAGGAGFRGLTELLAIVRDLDDRTLIETLNVSNLQRDDIHGLEEAQGFADLMKACGYDVKKIAARIGKSERYVYDSLTLLKLIPEAKKFFLAGRFERGHAIELARLTADWQKKMIDVEDVSTYRVGGLFQEERVGEEEQEDLDLEVPVKPVSVREFKKLIDEKVRFRPAETDPVLFPETAGLVGKATLDKEKVVEITYDFQVPEEARDPKAPKIHGAKSWRSATKGHENPGTYGSSGRVGEGKACEHSVLGVVVVGRDRGQAFRVCLAKEKCKTHWSDWQKGRKKLYGGGGGATQRDSYAEQEARRSEREREEAKRETERKRWEKALPAIRAATADKVRTLAVGPSSDLATMVVEHCTNGSKADTSVPRGRTLEDLVRHAAWQLIEEDVRAASNPYYYDREPAIKRLRKLGVDAAKIVDQVAPEEKPAKAEASAKKGKSAKKPAKGKKR